MTALRFVTLRCDSCRRMYSDGRSLRVADARERAAQRGWSMRRVPYGGGMRPRDLCPACGTVSSVPL